MAETEADVPPPDEPETAPAEVNETQPADEGEPVSAPPPDKPEEEEEAAVEDKPPGEEPPTLLGMVAEFLRNVYNNRYKWEIVTTTIMFLIALEIARELKFIAIPLHFYMPFKKLGECFRCIKCILTQ